MNAGRAEVQPPYSEKGTQGSRGVTISRLVKALSAPLINFCRSRNRLVGAVGHPPADDGVSSRDECVHAHGLVSAASMLA